MAWWNEGLTNVAMRLNVLGRITSRFEQLAKINPTGLGSDDEGIIRVNPNGGGLEKWSGTEWEVYEIEVTHGGTGVKTLAAAKLALGIGSGSLGSRSWG